MTMIDETPSAPAPTKKPPAKKPKKAATKAARQKVLQKTAQAIANRVGDLSGVEVAPRTNLSENELLLNQLERMARDPSIDVAKIAALWGMLKEAKAESARVAYAEAMHAMQPKLPQINKDGTIWTHSIVNGQAEIGEDGKPVQVVQNRYATWEQIDLLIRPVLHEHGFALTFDSIQDDRGLTIIAVLTHRKGHQTRTAAPLLPMDPRVGKSNPTKGWGSSSSYGKRYAAILALNITTREDDDDGGAAGEQGKDDGDRITEEQLATLEALIKQTGTNREQFTAWADVEQLKDMTTATYAKAKGFLDSKLRKMRAEKK
jgi:hypothetical protein